LQIIAEKNDSRAFCANPHDLRKKTFINPADIADHRGKKWLEAFCENPRNPWEKRNFLESR
jgi:hypothetical protein